MRDDLRPYWVKKAYLRFRHWYAEHFLRPACDSLGPHHTIMKPWYVHISGNNGTAKGIGFEIQSKFRLSIRCVGTVTLETMLRKNRANVSIELHWVFRRRRVRFCKQSREQDKQQKFRFQGGQLPTDSKMARWISRAYSNPLTEFQPLH